MTGRLWLSSLMDVVSPPGTGSLGGGHGLGVTVMTSDMARLGARGAAVDTHVCRLSREAWPSIDWESTAHQALETWRERGRRL